MKSNTTKYIHPHKAVCKSCGGTGVVLVRVDSDVYSNDVFEEEICETCEGSGLVEVSKRIIITCKPYKPGVKKKKAP